MRLDRRGERTSWKQGEREGSWRTGNPVQQFIPKQFIGSTKLLYHRVQNRSQKRHPNLYLMPLFCFKFPCTSPILLMGNSSHKVFLLDEGNNEADFASLKQEFGIVRYTNFKHLIEKENMKEESSKIIVCEKKGPAQNNTQKQDAMKRNSFAVPSPLSLLVEDTAVQGRFRHICPIVQSENKTMREEIIAYKRNYSLNISVYLLVDDITDVKVLESEKPYIEIITSNVEIIKDQIKRDNILKSHSFIKFDRLTRDMYRRIMVRILDKNATFDWQFPSQEQEQQLGASQRELWAERRRLREERKMLQDEKISFEYCISIEKLQNSSVSTNCEYVICGPDLLDELIDSRKITNSDYSIILRCGKDTKPRRKREIWAQCSDFREIINIMNRCSLIAEQEKPEPAENIIIVGRERMYADNRAAIKDRLAKALEKQGKLDSVYKNIKKLLVARGDGYFEELCSLLKNNAYSLVVVFEEGDFLEELKGAIRMSRWGNRVQLTSLPNVDTSGEGDELEVYLQKKVKSFLKVKFSIRFQIAPIFSIHYYAENGPDLYKKEEISSINSKLGVACIFFDQGDLVRFQPPVFEDIIFSRVVICSIKHFKEVIQPRLIEFKLPGCEKIHKSYLNRLKVILFDSRVNLTNYMIEADSVSPYICFMHNHISKVIEFVSNLQAPIVSLPFFRKGTLSAFQKASSILNNIKPLHCFMRIELTSGGSEIIKRMVTQELDISINYLIDFLVFSNSHKNLKFFQETYIDSYANLWAVGYKVFQVSPATKVMECANLEALKKDIINCFVICKMYDLLKVNDGDFPVFYAQKILACESFHDLQIACLYILSLPHGLNKVFANIFRNPQKSKLTIKIFCAFFFVLMTSFCQFENNEMKLTELVMYLKSKKDVDKVKDLKWGDVIVSGSFWFCAQNEEEDRVNRDCVIFELEDMSFIEQTRIRNYQKIENFSFYKEGTEFLIAPFAQFKVKENKVTPNGYRHLRLEQYKGELDYQNKTFVEMVLKANEIGQETLAQNLEQEIRKFNSGQRPRRNNVMEGEEKSLYKRNEAVNFELSKKKHIESLELGLLYNQYFSHFQKKRYVSAREALSQKIDALKKTSANEAQNLMNEKNLNFLKVENAFISYKMSEFEDAYLGFMDAKMFIEGQLKKEEARSSEKWVLDKINGFVEKMAVFNEHRSAFIQERPKQKKWVIEAHHSKEDNGIYFDVRGVKRQWLADYNQQTEKYELGILEKPPKDGIIGNPTLWCYAPEPVYNFGSNLAFWDDDDKLYEIRGYEKKEQMYQKKQSISLGLSSVFNNVAATNEVEGEQLEGLGREEWQVFYLEDKVKVLKKKKKLHIHANMEEMRKKKLNIGDKLESMMKRKKEEDQEAHP